MSGVGGELPKGWIRVRLEEIAEVRLGRQRSPKNHTGTHMRPYVRAANVGWNGLKLDDVKEMNFTDDEVETYRLKKGDIVLGEASGSAKEVGKPAIWNDEIPDCCFQNTLIRVRSNGIDPHYLLLFLRAEAMRGAFVEHSRGVGIHHIGAARLAGWSIPVPPVAEQERVVGYLEEKLSKLTAAEGSLDSATARTRAFRKSVLLNLIPDTFPSHWERTSIADAGELDLGRQRHPDWHVGPEMRPYLRVANVFEDRIDTRDVKEMDFSGVFDRYRLAPGDVLLNEGQSPELVGRPAIYRGDPPECAFTNSLLRFRARSGVLPEWALLVFRRHMHVGRFKKEARITTNIAHLSAARLKKVEFPIPSIQEQEQLIKLASERLGALDNLISEIGHRKQQATALRRSLLTEAFAGRLVPQNPTDNPAEELVARIRAEREAAAPKKRRTRRAPAQRKATHDEAPAAPPAPANTHTKPLTGVQPTLDLEFPS